MTTHAAQHSLPSFAQAFSSEAALGSISSGNNSLPPIHQRQRPKDDERTAGRKRARTEATRDDDGGDEEDECVALFGSPLLSPLTPVLLLQTRDSD